MRALTCKWSPIKVFYSAYRCPEYLGGICCSSKRRGKDPRCDSARTVHVIPEAVHEAQQAAIAAAVTTLQFALIDARRVGDTVACHTITEALALLRAVNEEADDA